MLPHGFLTPSPSTNSQSASHPQFQNHHSGSHPQFKNQLGSQQLELNHAPHNGFHTQDHKPSPLPSHTGHGHQPNKPQSLSPPPLLKPFQEAMLFTQPSLALKPQSHSGHLLLIQLLQLGSHTMKPSKLLKPLLQLLPMNQSSNHLLTHSSGPPSHTQPPSQPHTHSITQEKPS